MNQVPIAVNLIRVIITTDRERKQVITKTDKAYHVFRDFHLSDDIRPSPWCEKITTAEAKVEEWIQWICTFESIRHRDPISAHGLTGIRIHQIDEIAQCDLWAFCNDCRIVVENGTIEGHSFAHAVQMLLSITSIRQGPPIDSFVVRLIGRPIGPEGQDTGFTKQSLKSFGVNGVNLIRTGISTVARLDRKHFGPLLGSSDTTIRIPRSCLDRCVMTPGERICNEDVRILPRWDNQERDITKLEIDPVGNQIQCLGIIQRRDTSCRPSRRIYAGGCIELRELREANIHLSIMSHHDAIVSRWQFQWPDQGIPSAL